MPLGASRLTLLAKTQVTAAAEVIRKKVGVSAQGNAQVDTAQSKFGGVSALFDGTGDYLKAISNGFDFGTGDFTIECWVRSTVSGNQGVWQLSDDSGDHLKASSTSLAVAIRTDTSNWNYYSNGNNSSLGTSATNTWYHIALVRNSGTIDFYVDGTSVNSEADTNDYSGVYLAIGGYYSTSYLLTGHIDEFRISDTARYTTSFTPSTVPFTNDDNTKLLLHMNGTDASTFFEDDNGTGRSQVGLREVSGGYIDTSQSQFGGSSRYSNGGDALEVVEDFDWDGNEWTVEMWVRPTTLDNTFHLLDMREAGNTSVTHVAGIHVVSGSYYMAWYNGSSWQTNGSALSTGTWYHMAWVKSGTTVTMYLDGTSVGTESVSATENNCGYTIGARYSNYSNGFKGHIDEVRISTVNRYTTAFTPSTTPFANDADTALLLHMNGTDSSKDFRDDNGKIAGVGGLETGAYYTTNLGSDFSNISSDTSSWTVSWWHKASTQQSADGWALYLRDGAQNEFMARVETNGDIEVLADGNNFSVNSNYANLATTTGDNKWHHIAVDCNGTTVKLYVDGVDTGYSGTVRTIRAQSITGIGVGGSPFDGTQSDNGKAQIALWLSSQDLATNIDKLYNRGPVDLGSDGTATGLSQPELLFEGTDFSTNKGTDNINWNSQTLYNLNIAPAHLPLPGGRNSISVSAKADAQIDTAQSKIGGASALFDGTGDYLAVTPENSELAFGTGDFTIEYWFRYGGGVPSGNDMSWEQRPGSNGAYPLVYHENSTGSVIYFVDSSARITSSSLTYDTWYHLAIVRSSGTTTMYIDGTSAGTWSDSTNYLEGTVRIGNNMTATGGFSGHLDELRVSDSARYTSSFTPSTTPFQNDANTLLLLHMNGTDASTTFVDDNGYYA